MRKLKIALAATHFCWTKGGTQRFVANLANHLLESGHQPYILCWDYGQTPVFQLNAGIKFHLLPKFFNQGDQNEIAKMRKLLISEETDVFISFQTSYEHMLWALCCMGTGIPFVCSERTDPEFIEKYWNKPGRYAVLASADIIHALLPAYMEKIPDIWKNKTYIIPNCSPQPLSDLKPISTGDKKTILCLSRFKPQKRIDLLIQTFAILAPEFPQWNLLISGYGAEEQKLRELIKNMHLEKKVLVRAASVNVFDDYMKTHIYCLPTQLEGCPNTVLEAMSVGLPVVGISDCTAMRSMIQENITGFLAKEATPESLANVLRPIMSSAWLRKKIGYGCLEECRNNYNAEKILNLWEDLIYNAVDCKGRTIMDSFSFEPFASQARLSSMARREYIFRDFGDKMPYSSGWFIERGKTFFNNALKQSLQSLQQLRVDFSKFNLSELLCIVRSVGERTTEVCVDLLDHAFKGKTPIKIIEVQPFNEALLWTMKSGYESGKKWALVIDADVLIDAEQLLHFLNLTILADRNTFMIHACVMDKFFMLPRKAGNRLYQTKFMAEAIELISYDPECLRPEADLCNKMLSRGYKNYQSNIIIGLHDYEQFYVDILRKASLFALKHAKHSRYLMQNWNARSWEQDYLAAMDGWRCAENRPASIIIDREIISLCAPSIRKKWQKKEKEPLNKSVLTPQYINQLFQQELKRNLIPFPEEIRLMERR